MNKIPNKIHYCWFGGNPLPELAQKCIASWKKYCPDYEIIEWNESNFDINCCDYVKEAYEAKKWAFVSDYARFWILYKEGGIYFDTDVELIKSINNIVDKGPFMGCEKDVQDEKNIAIAPGLGLAANPGLGLYAIILDEYHKRHFRREDETYDLTTVVDFVTRILQSRGLKNQAGIQKIDEIYIYPMEYFCPLDYYTGQLNITENTYSIHHYMASWHTREQKLQQELQKKYKKYLPSKLAGYVAQFIVIKREKGFKEVVAVTIKWIKRLKR